MVNFDDPVCVFLTGASRGLGKGIALALSSKLAPLSVMILVGRDGTKLEEIKSEIHKLNAAVQVEVYGGFDCSNLSPAGLGKFLESLAVPDQLRQLLIIHNAATFGDPSQLATSVNLQTADEYMTVNFSSMVAANNLVLARFSHIATKTIVNITMGNHLMKISGTALYSAGKAARDTFFKIMAIEHPEYRILTYYPGSVDTAMREDILDNTCDLAFKARSVNKVPQTPKEAAKKLLTVLIADTFTSAERVEFTCV